MEQQKSNLDFLKEQLLRRGFGESHGAALEAHLAENKGEFQIHHQQKFGGDEVKATLHFKQSDQNNNYYFNKFDLHMQKAGQTESEKQTFFNDKRITLKEGYNLMNGRAVYKENLVDKIFEQRQLVGESEPYNAWMKLRADTDDNNNRYIRSFKEQHGFSLEKTLNRYPIRELRGEDDKAELMASLRKGNQQYVNLDTPKGKQSFYVEANPQARDLNFYDRDFQKVDIKEVLKNVEKQSEDQTKKQGQKAADDDKPAKRQGQKKGMSV